MVTWGAWIALIVSGLMFGLLQEKAPLWVSDAAIMMLAVSIFVLVCLFESGGRADGPDSSAS